ncbi:MAG: hypothetical protein ABI759_22640 [Candidatus Solibacter sp.]
MVIPARFSAALALAILCACRTAGPPAAIDPALAGRVPPATVALAGLDLDGIRSSPLYANLPPGARAFLAPFAGAHQALFASTGSALLVIARGVVPGAIQAAPGLALFGAPELAAAASGNHPPAAILTPAATVAPGHMIWIAARGGIALPLEGNLENINNLLRGAEFLTLTIQPAEPAVLELAAQCPTPESALHFEQTLRALATMAAAVNSRDAQFAAALQAIRIDRAERTVRAKLALPLDALSRLTFPSPAR